MLNLISNNNNNISVINGSKIHCNLEAESAILATILVINNSIKIVINTLKPEMFYFGAYRVIYEACLELYAEMTPIDIFLVSEKLKNVRVNHDTDLLEKIGGMNTLFQLVDRNIPDVNLDKCAQLVKQEWIKRQGEILSGKITDITQNYRFSADSPPLEELVEEATQEFLSLNTNSDHNETSTKIKLFRLQKLMEKISYIQLEVNDPLDKEYLMYELATETKYNVKQLYNLFFKSLISGENEKSMSLTELKEKYGNDVREWLLHGFIPKGTTTLIHALGGKGKTRLMYDFIYHLALGENWQGFPVTKKAKILIIQTDEQPADMVAALEQRGIDESFNIHYKTKWSIDHIPQLYREVEKERYDLILIDSLASISKFSTVSENDAEFARPILLLNKIACDFNTSIIMVHHSSKAGQARGTTATYNAVSQVLQIKEDTNDKRIDSCNRILCIQKSRARRPAEYKLEFNPIDGSWQCHGEENPNSITGMDADEPLRDMILNFLDQQRGVVYENIDLAHSLNVSEASVRRATLRLRQDGLISWKKEGKTNKFWIEPIVKECNKRSDHGGGDRKVIARVIVSHSPDTEQDSSTCDQVIAKNSKNLSESDKKNEKKCDQVIASHENSHPVNNSGCDHPCDHHAITNDQSDQMIANDQSSDCEVYEGALVLKNNGDSEVMGLIKEVHPLTNTYSVEWEMARDERTQETKTLIEICDRSQFILLEEL